MKKILFFLLIMSTMAYAEEQQTVQIPIEQARVIDSALQKGEEKIIKFAENHGKVQRILKTYAGEDVIIAEFSFSANHVYESLSKLDADIVRFKDPVWIKKQIENLEVQKAKILNMKTVLEGEVTK